MLDGWYSETVLQLLDDDKEIFNNAIVLVKRIDESINDFKFSLCRYQDKQISMIKLLWNKICRWELLP